MGQGTLGFWESVSFALGGIIGGGIFAVLGVVAKVAGPTAWLAYFAAGIVAMCTGYSYVKLNQLSDSQGGSVTFIEEFIGRPMLAGMVGWMLIVGYIGTMAMYGFAFGAYFGQLFGLSTIPVVGLPTRPVMSVLVVAGFVGLNVIGARESGVAEDVLVALKVGIVVLFGVIGIWFAYTQGQLKLGIERAVRHPAGPFVAAAVSFVSFEGWQLLMYDQDRIENPVENITKAVYLSIPISTLVYMAVALVTISLVSRGQVVRHPDVALAIAAKQFAGQIGYVLIGIAALLSTASAINATMFSTALFSKGMLADDLLPDKIGDASDDGPPTRTLVIIGLLTAVFTAYGSLEAITEFASVSFIVVFGAMSYLAFRERDNPSITAVVPAIGMLGSAVFLPLLLWHLYTTQRGILALVVGITVSIFLLELVYFERKSILQGVRNVEKRI
ncbi:APC family permease [Haladaptatus pallidirubidus]|uniref:Amino acid permease n=1 Tax=Haladaptatus pallidirubidus TaxID=1008152 RepID=A0AAV3UKT1_9EURY|nr:APC family permease [Haladaptatus pallidirubidus]